MNILLIISALIVAYLAFVFISYAVARLLFPKIEVEDEVEVKHSMEIKPTRRIRERAIRVVKV
jgi:hypothetical protein